MLTKEKLLSFTPKELEDYLNSKVENITETNVDPKTIRWKMNSVIEGFVSDEIEFDEPLTTGTEISLTLDDRLTMTIKTSVKNTEKKVRVTKLRNSYLKKPNKFKIDSIRYLTKNYSTNLTKEDSWEVEISDEIHYSHNSVNITNMDLTFNEMLDRGFLMGEINKKYELGTEYKDLDDYILLHMMQPVIQKLMSYVPYGEIKESFSRRRIKKGVPKKYYDMFDETIVLANFFEDVKQIIGKINKEKVEELKTKMID